MKIDNEKVMKNIQEFQNLAKDNPYFDADASDMDKGDSFDNVVHAVVNQVISKGKAVELLDMDYGDFHEYLINKEIKRLEGEIKRMDEVGGRRNFYYSVCQKRIEELKEGMKE